MRKSRNLSQEELASRVPNTTQSMIARYENPDYGKFSLSTLIAIASAFDVGLLVRFVPYSEMVERVADLSPEALDADSYDQNGGLLQQRKVTAESPELLDPNNASTNPYQGIVIDQGPEASSGDNAH
jgi:transcriptional regulator with XRE-family HTH domain